MLTCVTIISEGLEAPRILELQPRRVSLAALLKSPDMWLAQIVLIKLLPVEAKRLRGL